MYFKKIVIIIISPNFYFLLRTNLKRNGKRDRATVCRIKKEKKDEMRKFENVNAKSSLKSHSSNLGSKRVG